MRTLFVALSLIATLTACKEDNSELAVLEIVGSYTDAFDGTHEITEDTWTQGGFGAPSVFHITTFENGSDWLVAENDAGNEFSAGLWSRFDWTSVDGDLWFCQTAFDAADEAAAIALAPADAAALETDGCGGFAWSLLTPVE